jgi:hypothetical protein
MKTLKIDLVPAQKANTVYTIELDKAELVVIKAALAGYAEERTKLFKDLFMSVPDDWCIALAKELGSSLPYTGE